MPYALAFSVPSLRIELKVLIQSSMIILILIGLSGINLLEPMQEELVKIASGWRCLKTLGLLSFVSL